MVGSCDECGGGGYCVGATDVAGIFACESVTASFSIFAPFEIPQVTFESQLPNFRVVTWISASKVCGPHTRYKLLNLLRIVVEG